MQYVQQTYFISSDQRPEAINQPAGSHQKLCRYVL